MELVEGRTLHQLIREKGRLEPEEALRLLAPVADAVDHAHRAGIVHRDIKPANIMVQPDGQPKLMDFGVAKIEASVMTTAGEILGLADLHVAGADRGRERHQPLRRLLARGRGLRDAHRPAALPGQDDHPGHLQGDARGARRHRGSGTPPCPPATTTSSRGRSPRTRPAASPRPAEFVAALDTQGARAHALGAGRRPRRPPLRRRRRHADDPDSAPRALPRRPRPAAARVGLWSLAARGPRSRSLAASLARAAACARGAGRGDRPALDHRVARGAWPSAPTPPRRPRRRPRPRLARPRAAGAPKPSPKATPTPEPTATPPPTPAPVVEGELVELGPDVTPPVRIGGRLRDLPRARAPDEAARHRRWSP